MQLNNFYAILFKTNLFFDKKEKIKFFYIVLSTFFFSVIELIGLSSIILLLINIFDSEMLYKVNLISQKYFSISFERNYLIITLLTVVLIKYVLNFILINFSQKQLRNLENSIIKKSMYQILNSKSEYLFSKNSLAIVRQIIIDMNIFFKDFLRSYIEIFREFFLLLLIFLTFLFFSELKIILIFLLLIIIFLMIIKIFKRSGIKRSKIRYKYRDEFFDKLANYFQILKDVRIKNINKNFINARMFQFEKLNDANIREILFQHYLRFTFELFFFTIIILLVLYFFLINSSKYSLAFLILTTIPAMRIMPSFIRINTYINKINFHNQLVKKIFQQIKELNENLLPKFLNEKYDFKNKICIKNIEIKYDNNIILKNANFSLFKNKSHIIFGPSGSGKSTLISCILGFKNFSKVNIFLDNNNKTVNFDSVNWRNLFSYVDQRTRTINGTLAENISLEEGPLGTDKETRIMHLLNQFNLLSELEIKNVGDIYKNIKNFGNGISGGQMQRLGICRACYDDRKIIIFDEPTSSLNKDLVKTITKKLISIEKTIIFISHDENLKNYFDYKYIIQDKKILKLI